MSARAALKAALPLLAAFGAPVHGAGIEMTLTARDPAGGPARAHASVELAVDIRNAGSGYPLRGLHPSAWIRPRPGPEPTAPDACVAAARGYSGKGGLPAGVTDLNGFTVVTLNDDRTLAVADPSLDLATANLLLVARLGAHPRELAIDHAGAAAYLTLPEGVARVDLEDGRRVTLAIDGGPGEILRDPRTGALWVALDEAGAVTRIGGSGLAGTAAAAVAGRGAADAARPLVSGDARIAVGPGPVRLALDAGGGRVFALAGDGALTAIDDAGPGVLWRTRTGDRVSAVAYSALADSVYVALAEGGSAKLLPFLAESGRALTAIALPGRGDRLAVTPAGRMLLTLDRDTGLVGIVDLARGVALQALQFVNAPDDLTLTDAYAYIHHTAAPRVSLIALAGLERGHEAAVIDVPFGSTAPAGSTSARAVRVASGAAAEGAGPMPIQPLVAAIPHGGGAVVVNAADRTAFVYMEDGMQAPMTAFRLKAGEPRRVAVRDRRLSELGDGRYVSTACVGPPGDYELVIALAEPPAVNCLPLRIDGDAEAPERRHGEATVIARLEGEARAGAGLQVALADAAGVPVSGVSDLQFLVMAPNGSWLRRGFARPAAQGRYRVDIRLPGAGEYRVLLRSASLGLDFEQTGGLHATVDQ